ncbi:MAG: hypothetical protein K8I82_13605 [Anaerolineae bacterium]|nr:hypothetical protein [Anaerolineae bacterium]
MAKSKGKPKETVLLIRIPDAEARRGEASLTIQRGDLGHLTQFNYTGLTLRGNIAEAVQAALIALTKLEMSPPPKFNTPDTPAHAETTVTTDTSTAENESDTDDDEVDTPDEDEGEEGEASAEGDDDDETAPVEVKLSSTPEASDAESSAYTTSASLLIPALPDNTAQMSLF